MMTSSLHPPQWPEADPTRVPSPMDNPIATNPTVSDAFVPWSNLIMTSLPSLSVPRGCSSEGNHRLSDRLLTCWSGYTNLREASTPREHDDQQADHAHPCLEDRSVVLPSSSSKAPSCCEDGLNPDSVFAPFSSAFSTSYPSPLCDRHPRIELDQHQVGQRLAMTTAIPPMRNMHSSSG